MKAVVAAVNQENALVGAFSVITNLRMDLFEALGGCRGRRPPLTAPTVQSVADEERGGGGLGGRRSGPQPQERGHLGLQQRAAGPGQGGGQGLDTQPQLI